MRLNGIDAVMLGRDELKKMIPFADFSSTARFPIFGALNATSRWNSKT